MESSKRDLLSQYRKENHHSKLLTMIIKYFLKVSMIVYAEKIIVYAEGPLYTE